MACSAGIWLQDANELGGIGDRMSINRLKLGAAAAVAVGAVIPFAAAPANAGTAAPQGHSLHVVKTLSSNFVGPLQFAVSGPRVYVADSFTSALFRIGRSTPLATGPDPSAGGDIAGVAVDHSGALAYASSNGDHSTTTLTILRHGKKPVVADLSGFEAKRNPDGAVHFGVHNPSTCVSDALKAADIPVSYTGTVDSHPYAVTSLGHGSWAVADAGGNDI